MPLPSFSVFHPAKENPVGGYKASVAFSGTFAAELRQSFLIVAVGLRDAFRSISGLGSVTVEAYCVFVSFVYGLECKQVAVLCCRVEYLFCEFEVNVIYDLSDCFCLNFLCLRVDNRFTCFIVDNRNFFLDNSTFTKFLENIVVFVYYIPAQELVSCLAWSRSVSYATVSPW